ncbi:hypothetical protein Tco_0872039 [Tanacetum coccineum]
MFDSIAATAMVRQQHIDMFQPRQIEVHTGELALVRMGLPESLSFQDLDSHYSRECVFVWIARAMMNGVAPGPKPLEAEQSLKS